MDEQKENIHGKDVNVKMTEAQDDLKVGLSRFVDLNVSYLFLMPFCV